MITDESLSAAYGIDVEVFSIARRGSAESSSSAPPGDNRLTVTGCGPPDSPRHGLPISHLGAVRKSRPTADRSSLGLALAVCLRARRAARRDARQSAVRSSRAVLDSGLDPACGASARHVPIATSGDRCINGSRSSASRSSSGRRANALGRRNSRKGCCGPSGARVRACSRISKRCVPISRAFSTKRAISAISCSRCKPVTTWRCPVLQKHVAATADLHLDIRFQGSAGCAARLIRSAMPCGGFSRAGIAGRGAGVRQGLEASAQAGRHKLIGCSRRMQGLMVRREHAALHPHLPGRGSAPPAVRESAAGSGTRMLIDHLMHEHSLNPSDLPGYGGQTEETHVAVALCVASGLADAGVGVEAAALEFGLHFAPWWRRITFSPA